MLKRYHLEAYLLLVLILNLTALLTQKSTSHLPTLGQGLATAVNSSISLLGCWFLHAKLKMNPPVAWFSKYAFWIDTLAGMIAIILIDCLLDLITPQKFIANDPSVPKDLKTRLWGSLFLSATCYAIFNSLYTRDMLQQTRLEVEQLKQAGLRTQVIGLQQQLSPHFLFNSLSTLKGLTSEQAPKEFIMQLSRTYRYLLDSAEQQVVSLNDELTFTMAYLYVQEQRFGRALRVSIDIAESYFSMILPPLSLQLLVENAIKHNGFSQEQPLSIAIYINEDTELVVLNNCNPNSTAADGKGVGLQNIRDRFLLLLKKNITVIAGADQFKVSLPLTSHEDYYY